MRCEWPVLTRCCFCLPLRRGVLVFGYLNILVSIAVVALYARALQARAARAAGAGGGGGLVLYHGLVSDQLPEELGLAAYCLELVFNVALVVGAHKGSARLLRSFFYFALASTAAVLLLQLLELARPSGSAAGDVEYLTIAFSGVCIQVYTMTLVKNLLDRLQRGAGAEFDNQLHPLAADKDVV